MHHMEKSELKILAAVCSMASAAAMAINDPPYEVFLYLADTTDNPPLNYMKVCDPGRSEESNATYVVLGISYPRTYQAVSGNYSGDLVIPAYIDGLPVRKVDGDPVVSWEPVLPASEAAKRTYTVFGRQSLYSGDWTPVPSGHARDYNFFKVTVEMK